MPSEEYMKDHTVIIIAHRYSSIKNVDKIFVMDEGRITEMGTHEELLQENGIYCRLYMKQIAGVKHD